MVTDGRVLLWQMFDLGHRVFLLRPILLRSSSTQARFQKHTKGKFYLGQFDLGHIFVFDILIDKNGFLCHERQDVDKMFFLCQAQLELGNKGWG